MKKPELILIILSFLLANSCKEELNETNDTVIESYLYANKQFDSLKLGQTIANDILFNLQPINNAIVKISVDDKEFILKNIKERPGIYVYPDTDFIIKPGKLYKLSAIIANKTIKAWTQIPARSSNPHLSNDTIYQYNNIDIYKMKFYYSTLSWIPVTKTSLVIKKLITSNLPEDSNSVSFIPYFYKMPVSSNVVSINSMDFEYTGSYNIIVCQINDDLKKLYSNVSDSPSSIFQSNIDGAYGIFTGIYSDTVRLEVRKDQ